jgi:hypothetical protein
MPLGTLIILPSLILTPPLTFLPDSISKGVAPFPFPGNCDLFQQPKEAPTEPARYVEAWNMLPNGTCFPPGNLYYLTNLTDSLGVDFSKLGLPNGTVIINNQTIYIPPGVDNTTKPNLPGTNWTLVNETDSTPEDWSVVNGTTVISGGKLGTVPGGWCGPASRPAEAAGGGLMHHASIMVCADCCAHSSTSCPGAADGLCRSGGAGG